MQKLYWRKLKMIKKILEKPTLSSENIGAAFRNFRIIKYVLQLRADNFALKLNGYGGY